jgi:hypothetical protein
MAVARIQMEGKVKLLQTLSLGGILSFERSFGKVAYTLLIRLNI